LLAHHNPLDGAICHHEEADVSASYQEDYIQRA
jgi:hypothetical protein